MNNIAIAFSTKDRTELSKQSIEPLLQPDKFSLFWSDGSSTSAGEEFARSHEGACKELNVNVRGGADAAIVFNLTAMLRHPARYEYVGLVENDVLLDDDWFEPTMALFEKGKAEGLEVGAVSGRCYEDRILCQRDGYALMHNLGAGMVVFTRRAAELVLAHFRTGWTMENRRTFMQLAGIDIGTYWAFRGVSSMLCADWQFDRVLAQHGLASLALTPAKCRMIGQEPPLEEQGLTLAAGPVEQRRNDEAIARFAEMSAHIRAGELWMPNSRFLYSDDGTFTYFPHQIEQIGGKWNEVGDWTLRWAQGFGPFAFRATDSLCYPVIAIPVSGPCTFLVSGGEDGGKISIADEASGYENTLVLNPEGASNQIMQLAVPAAVSYRNVRLAALSPGVVFYGLVTKEAQPVLPDVTFDHTRLPPP